jgi:phosphatidylinositol kinase/protein kinase (PI-3  family)
MNPLNKTGSHMSPEEQQAYAQLLDLMHKFGAIPEMGDKYVQLQNRYFEQEVQWNEQAGDVNYPFISIVDGEEWKLRLNDFPEEYLYTLIVNDKAIFSFNDLPETWKYPPEG